MAINSVFGPKVFVVYKSSGLGKPSLPNYRLFFGKNVVADLTFAGQFNSTLKRSISSIACKEILYILFLLAVTLHLELLCSPLFDLDSLRLQRNTLGK